MTGSHISFIVITSDRYFLFSPFLIFQIPSSSINVGIGGVNLGINLDGQNVDLGGMPPISTDINLDSSDHLMAVIAPLILSMVVLPFVTMRSAMMELDCFIARRKSLSDLERVQRHKRILKKKKKDS